MRDKLPLRGAEGPGSKGVKPSGLGECPPMRGKLWELCSPAQLGRLLLGARAQDLRKMVQPKERTPDLPPKSNAKDTSQTDSSCLIKTGNIDSTYF